jgi:glycosyltransferase involved in cell wall biosynthesis
MASPEPSEISSTAYQDLAEEQAKRISQLEAELAIVYCSRSWRLTAVLRRSRVLGQEGPPWLGWRLRIGVRWVINHFDSLASRLGRAIFRRVSPDAQKIIRVALRRPAGPSLQALPVHQLVLVAQPTLVLAPVGQVVLRDGRPLVSVVVPCFNYGEFVREAVESVLRQTLRSVEVIVVDDGSTDEQTVAILDALDLPRTIVLRRPNGGLPSARNQGITASQGRYICCLDADDRLSPTYLEKAVALLEADRGVGFVYSWVQLFGDEHDVWRTEPFDLSELRVRNFIPVSAVFRRDDWEITGGYAQDMRDGYEDWEFWLRLGALGRRGVLIPEALFEHRLHGRTMVFKARERHASLVARLTEQHARLYEDRSLIAQHAQSYAVVPALPPFRNLDRLSGTGANEARPRARVLALVPWLTAGGAEAVLHGVLHGLRTQHGVRLTIVTCTPSNNEWQPRFAELTDEIYHLPAFLPRELWAPFVHHLVRARRIDSIVVSGSPFGYDGLPVLKREFPSVRMVDILHNAAPSGHIDRSVKYTSSIDYHVVVARGIADVLAARGILASRIHVIPNGVDTQLFDPARYDRAESMRELNLAVTRPVITYVGRLNEEKQPLEFLAAATKLADTPAQFILVGDGRQRDAVAARLKSARLRNRVHWLKNVPPERIPAILAASDALTITSTIEGLPIVILEALAMGVPVFTFDVGDVRAAVSAGFNGYVFEPGDMTGLVAGLRGFVNDPVQRHALQAAARPGLLERGLTLAAQQRAYASILIPNLAEAD